MDALNDSTAAPSRQGSRVGLVLAIVGALMQLGPFIGLAGTMIGMVKAFHEMGASGVGDPSGLGKSIGEVLISTMAGIVVSFGGIVLMIIGLVVYQCRQRWLIWLLVVVGVFWAALVPGLIILSRLKEAP